MLHRIKQIAEINLVENILRFQREVLVFACNHASAKRVTAFPTEWEVKRYFATRGVWLWARLKKADGNLSGFGKAMELLIVYCHANPTERQAIIDAFDHDVTFDQSLDDPNFRFLYFRLRQASQTAVRPLMEWFYELLHTGYPEEITGKPALAKEKFDRKDFVEKFYELNEPLNVCPACDSKRPDRGHSRQKAQDDDLGSIRADVDHFFPKSVYPFLSVHPANLVPICIECNRAFKGDEDPVEDHSQQPLLNCFQPYQRPAIEFVLVEVQRPPIKTAHGNANITDRTIVRISEKNGEASSRVKGMIRVFDLETRWSSRLKSAKTSIIHRLPEWYRVIRKYGDTPTAELLRENLESEQQVREVGVGTIEEYVLQTSYLRFALSDYDEFDELYKQYSGV